MNKFAQVRIYALMVGIVIMLLGIYFAKPITDLTTGAMQNTTETALGLNCTDGSIDNYRKATCIATDLIAPYFVGLLIFLGGGILVAKFAFGD